MVHTIPSTPEAVAEQNYQRGVVSAFEMLLNLESEWKQWKESQRKKP